jgi:hypothetical protein
MSMRALHRLAFAFSLAFALLLGEHAGLLHELGHGFQRIHAPSREKSPVHDACDKCFTFSQLSGPAPGALATLALVAAANELPRFVAIPAPSRTVVASRSRAPPSVP